MKISKGLCVVGLGAVLLGACGKKEEAGTTGADNAAGAPASATAAPTPVPVPVPTPTITAKPVNNDADANAISACCSALKSAADSEKAPGTKMKLTSASGMCSGYVTSVKSGAMSRASALSSLRAAAGGKPLPGGCN